MSVLTVTQRNYPQTLLKKMTHNSTLKMTNKRYSKSNQQTLLKNIFHKCYSENGLQLLLKLYSKVFKKFLLLRNPYFFTTLFH